ncbi:MAG: hypothetical protein AB1Z98_17010 [Nannocystaceae bacterium]
MRCLTCSLVIASWSLGCAADNAAFDEQRASGSGSASGSASGGVDGSTTEPDVADETSADPGGCELHPDDRFELEIRVGTQAIEPMCGSFSDMLVGGPISQIQYPPSGQIQLTACQDQVCETCSGEEVSLDFKGSLPLPPDLPECGFFTTWAGLDDGECSWQGVALWDSSGSEPLFVASNVRDPLGLPQVGLGLSSVNLCSGQCGTFSPGQHALVVVNETVTVGQQPPAIIEASLQMGSPPRRYEFINRTSSITEDCREQVSWTARRLPD